MKAQATVIFIIVLLILAVLIGVLIARGGIWIKPTPTPTEWWGTPIVTPTANIPLPEVTKTVDIPKPTATISPTLTPTVTEYPTPQITWEPTIVMPTYAIVRDCAPRFVWEACYWRCCSDR